MAEQFPRSAEQVASFIVKKKEASPGGTKRLSQFSGSLFSLVPGASKSTQTACLSTSEMITIQQSTHLSNSNMRQLASCLNKLTPKGSGVEPYFQAKFARSGEVTKEFFQSSQLCLQKQDQEVERTVVHCKDVEGFVWHVLEARCCSAPETLLKISLDNGGGFFKICLQVINLTEDSKSSETRKLSFQKEVISTSVKKVFILSIVQDMSESY
jgi:hypothetical protein